ncbi:MAG TPA: hypothetical protein PLV92_19185, partial [Pirellulaceae bacterium]|nr:hypothetical protein [Pirellulaceae bacterium]
LSRLWKQAALYTVQLADAASTPSPGSPTSSALSASSASSDETQSAAGSKSAAGSQGASDRDASGSESSRDDASRSAAVARSAILQHWSAQATANYQALLDLLESIRDYRIPAPASRHDAMLEYDQRRYAKESLMEQVVETAIETVDARRLLLASSLAQLPGAAGSRLLDTDRGAELLTPLRELESDQRQATLALASLLRNDVAELNRRWPELIAALRSVALLYVPLAKGGEPRTIVAARLRQRTLQDLLTCLPRRGCYVQTCQLIDAARDMERMFPVGPGAVTEFDELFKVGFKAMVGCLIDTARHWPSEPSGESRDGSGAAPTGSGPFSGASFEGIDPPPHELVECLEKLTEAQLLVWLAHSKTLRLSVLEKVQDKRAWKKTVKFIEQYGHDLFTQHFLNVGNIRSILHRGVETWLTQLMEDPDQEFSPRLLDELGRAIPQSEAVEQLTLILEAIHENYGEYRDYNSTTTQSDRGEMLYTLLDFLRLRTRYDRIAWNLKPVVWVHEVLARRGQENAAAVWRRALSERIHEESDQFMSSLSELQKRYAMRMPTVADRLAERFIRPLAIDRIRAFVAPAVREAEAGGPHPVFDLLEKETDLLTLQPSGVGLDPPPWLLAL